MKITILNSTADHPVNTWLIKWIEKYQNYHQISLVRSKHELNGGDILFLISCSELIDKQDREKFKKTLVIHASDLPKGRGWSPHIWEIIHGADEITLSLLEAVDEVDSGDIWKKIKINIPKTALYNKINALIFDAEIELIDYAVANFNKIRPQKQNDDINPTFWPKRNPKDSEVDVNKSIADQIDLIRTCDPNRFPAFFYRDGKKYILKIEVADE